MKQQNNMQKKKHQTNNLTIRIKISVNQVPHSNYNQYYLVPVEPCWYHQLHFLYHHVYF